MEYKNAHYTEKGTIYCEINHTDLGWIPFHATPDDTEEFGRMVFEELKDVANPYVEPSQ